LRSTGKADNKNIAKGRIQKLKDFTVVEITDSRKGNRILQQVIILFMLASILAFSVNRFSDRRLPLICQPARMEPGSFLTLEIAWKLHQTGAVIFIDARSESEYKNGHIPGAFNLPLNWPRSKKIALLDKFTKQSPFVIYCADDKCLAAERLAGELIFFGFKNLSIFTDGWKSWKEAGFSDDKN
jgi:rhodanese-related sulfurtransferase